jgi:hypothetical protein
LLVDKLLDLLALDFLYLIVEPEQLQLLKPFGVGAYWVMRGQNLRYHIGGTRFLGQLIITRRLPVPQFRLLIIVIY